MTKNVLISQDLSCYGQVSSAVALPILGACGYQPSLLPTALLSTHTGGFGENTYLDLTNEMKKIAAHWQAAEINFDVIYLGYLGGNAVDFWLKNIHQFTNQDQLCLLDPAMGDHGKLYSRIDENYVAKMRQLAKAATILTPNLTEAMYLLGEKIPEEASLRDIAKIAQKLAQKFSLKNVVITGIPQDKQIAIVGYEDGNFWQLEQEKLPGSYFGTGDMFASSFLAMVLAGKTLKEAARIAGDFVKTAIKNTPAEQDKRLGPNYAAGLGDLMKETRREDENE